MSNFWIGFVLCCIGGWLIGRLVTNLGGDFTDYIMAITAMFAVSWACILSHADG